MSSGTDGYFDIDECLRARELVTPKSPIAYMLIAADVGQSGQVIGEKDFMEVRGGGGFKGLIDVHGYFFSGYKSRSNGKPRYQSLTIIKRTDITTPALSHLLNNNEEISFLSLFIFHHNQAELAEPILTGSGYKEGIGYQKGNLIPWFQIKLNKLKIKAMSTFTSKDSHLPLDAISFDFLSYRMEIHYLTTNRAGMTQALKGANMCEFGFELN